MVLLLFIIINLSVATLWMELVISMCT
jgi:hypothetical protein